MLRIDEEGRKYEAAFSKYKNEGGPGQKFMRFGGQDLETFGNL